MTWSGAVLTGGASSRMGRDKALLLVDGEAMAARTARALRAAGASEVFCVGGDVAGLGRLGLAAVPDEHPGAGPLGGVLTALAHAGHALVVVAPCDLVDPRPVAFAALVAAVEADPSLRVAMPGLADPLPAAVARSALGRLRERFAGGERALHRAFATLPRIGVPGAAGPDADHPSELGGRPGGTGAATGDR